VKGPRSQDFADRRKILLFGPFLVCPGRCNVFTLGFVPSSRSSGIPHRSSLIVRSKYVVQYQWTTGRSVDKSQREKMNHSESKKALLHRSNTREERNVTEQLRYNHIETLEVLTQTQLENDRLIKLVEVLKKKILSLGGNFSDDEQDDNGEQNVITETVTPSSSNTTVDLAQLTAKQAKEITVLKEQLKNQYLEERKKINEIQSKQQQEFSQQIMRLAQREKELIQQVKTLEQSLSSIKEINGNCESLQHTVMDLTEHLQLKDNEILAMKLENQITKNELLECQESLKTAIQQANQLSQDVDLKRVQVEILNQTFDGDVKHYQQSLATLNHEWTLLQHRNEALSTRCKELESEKAKMIAESNSIKRKNDNVVGIRQIVISSKSETSLMKSEQHLEKNTDVPPSPSHHPTPVAALDDTMIADDDDCSIMTSGGFRFQEFIRLKRENKELKMQLADITSGKSFNTNSSRRSFDSSPRNAPTSSSRTSSSKATPAVKFPRVSNGLTNR
jgi:hypothetical protein